MDKTTTSMKVSDVIKTLQNLQKKFGDKEVVLSSDPEGNSFGTLDDNVGLADYADNCIILYPTEQFTDF